MAYTGRKIRLYPNERQKRYLLRYAGAARFAWNETLSYCNTIRDATGSKPSQQECRKHLRDLRDNTAGYEWLSEIPESITKRAINDLFKAYDKAYQNWNKNKIVSKKKTKDGNIINPYGFPRYHAKRNTTPSFYQRPDTFHVIRLKKGNRGVKIIGIPTPIKIKYRRIPDKIVNPRVTFDGVYWYLSWSVETENPKQISSFDAIKQQDVIGVDVGLKHLAVTSTGLFFDIPEKANPKLKRLLRRKKYLQRRLSRKYKENKDTNGNIIKTRNIVKLEAKIRKLDRVIANVARDVRLAVVNSIMRLRPKVVVIEDINVNGLFSNKHLSGRLQRVGIGEFLSLLECACVKYGVLLVKVDRFFPSTRLCSDCGACSGPCGFDGLGVREWVCSECGCVHERDVNAALNLVGWFFDNIVGSVCQHKSLGSPMSNESSHGEIGDYEASIKVRDRSFASQKSCENATMCECHI